MCSTDTCSSPYSDDTPFDWIFEELFNASKSNVRNTRSLDVKLLIKARLNGVATGHKTFTSDRVA